MLTSRPVSELRPTVCLQHCCVRPHLSLEFLISNLISQSRGSLLFLCGQNLCLAFFSIFISILGKGSWGTGLGHLGAGDSWLRSSCLEAFLLSLRGTWASGSVYLCLYVYFQLWLTVCGWDHHLCLRDFFVSSLCAFGDLCLCHCHSLLGKISEPGT